MNNYQTKYKLISSNIKENMLYYKKFTLVELMIVISVVFILAGLLLPALNNTRKKGNEIFCLNNLKQIGIASVAYANDFNGYCPNSSNGILDSSSTNLWDWQVMPYLNYPQDVNVANAINRFSIFHCPSKIQTTISKYRSRSYAENRYISVNNNNMAKWGTHKYPSKILFFCEGSSKTTTTEDLITFTTMGGIPHLAPTSTFSPYISYPHSNRSSVLLFSDLHSTKGKMIFFSSYNVWVPGGTLWFNDGLICE